jgi:hypothetical protein
MAEKVRDVVKRRYIVDKIAWEQVKKLRDEGMLSQEEYHAYHMQYLASKKQYERDKRKLEPMI